MSLLTLIAVPVALIATGPDRASPFFGSPIDDASLATVAGMANPTTRLSVFVQEQGVSQSQLPGEDLRASLSNWFADANIQMLANDVLLSG